MLTSSESYLRSDLSATHPCVLRVKIKASIDSRVLRMRNLPPLSSKSSLSGMRRNRSPPMSKIGALCAAIKCIYDSMPESGKGLGDQVLGYARRHHKRLLTLKKFKAVLAEDLGL